MNPRLFFLLFFSAVACFSAPGQQNSLRAYYTRLPFDDQNFTGKYADIIVQVGGKGQFVFCRQYGYQPYWQPAGGKKISVSRIIERKGDGAAERPDNHNIACNAAIVEQSPSSVKVHWRYAPDITKPSFSDFHSAYNEAGNPSPFYADYADEYFTISADGTVLREVRKGAYKFSDWEDGANTVSEKIVLTASGLNATKLSSSPKAKTALVKGEIKKSSPLKGAVLHWAFDEGATTGGGSTTEAVTQTSTPVNGVAAYWRRGVSGTCLSFDSYSNSIELSAGKTPSLNTAFSIEAWVAPQEYPFNDAAIIDHLKGKAGYFLGLSTKGEVVLKIANGDSVYRMASSIVPLYKWSHVAASFSKESGIAVYINGAPVFSSPYSISFKDAPATPLFVGMTGNTKQYPSGAERDITRSYQTNFCLSSLLDEVRVYNRSLTASDVLLAYKTAKPTNSQPLQPLPLPITEPGKGFGAAYTKLTYSPEWDGLWRVGNYADIVVNFEASPWRYVFWRGTRYLPSLVTGNDAKAVWSSDQSPEHFNGQCFEHMSDMQCRFGNVRLIHNSPARVVVHWRNSSGSIGYTWPKLNSEGWGIWTDEYWSIYPDGIAVRHQVLHNGSGARIIEMNQNEILHSAGQTVNDVLMDDALSFSDADGAVETLYRSRQPADKNYWQVQKNLQYINLNSDTKQFQIGEPGMKMDVDLYRDIWWNGWNHYPVQLIPSDGTQIFHYDRPSSSCIATFREVRHQLDSTNLEAYTIYGLTKRGPAGLTGLNRAWNFAPELKVREGATSKGFLKAERAYQLVKENGRIKFSIAASEKQPLFNPVFSIGNWAETKNNFTLTLNGKRLKEGTDYKEGIEVDTDASTRMVIWLKLETASPVEVMIEQ